VNFCCHSESNNPSSAAVLFHEVGSTPTVYIFDITLQQNAVVKGICGTKILTSSANK
jgi:hypothetical protein